MGKRTNTELSSSVQGRQVKYDQDGGCVAQNGWTGPRDDDGEILDVHGCGGG
jgi:hypothetical protein